MYKKHLYKNYIEKLSLRSRNREIRKFINKTNRISNDNDKKRLKILTILQEEELLKHKTETYNISQILETSLFDYTNNNI